MTTESGQQKSVTEGLGNASPLSVELEAWKTQRRTCEACGRDFFPARRKQKVCCGPRGRIRAWRAKQGMQIDNYYGA
jgi:ribosomal protein S27AE